MSSDSIRPARVCIVTPGQLGSNPRVVKEAETLASAGYEVRVVSSKVAQFVEARDQAILGRATYRVSRQSFENRLLWQARRLRQLVAKRCWSIVPSPELAELSHSAMTVSLSNAAQLERADLYIAHYVAALPAAAHAARRFGVRYAFDAEDFHLGDLPDVDANLTEKSLIRAIEGRYLPNAVFVTAASSGIADAYASTYKIKIPSVVLNSFPKAQSPDGWTAAGSIAPGPTLYWFSQTIGPNRGLECAVAAVARSATRPHLHLRGTPAAGYDRFLMQHAAALGVSDRLHIHEPADPEDMVRLASEYDAGLVAEDGGTRNRQIALTNKQFTYLLAGIPAIMSDTPAHKEFAAEAGEAVITYRIDDPDSLAAAIDTLFSNPTRLAMLRAKAFSLGQERYNWEAEVPALLSRVSQALQTIGSFAR